MADFFHDIAPKSVACTSSSKKPCYDVFINHRGKDVKLTLASCIYHMLDPIVKVFLDQEELELGDSFPQAIEEAMRSASIHIAIFSPSYAESPWCLEELSLMLQINVTIIPVFYGVEATDLRYATKGIYAEAFRQHQLKRRYKPEKIKEWEEALSRASHLNGCIVAGDKCDVGNLSRKIVDTALYKMEKLPLKVATFPVGLEEAVQDFEREVVSNGKNVHIVGILGMGGIGKTTLATELYNRKRSSFMSRCSFLFNVKAASLTNSLHKLQKKLLKDLLIQYRPFHTKEEGEVLLAKDLSSMAVLIVLDDVDHVDQIRVLLPSNLGQGSLIIVTTREKNVLTSSGISSIYPMKRLDPFNAKLLFCRHAFLQRYSQLDFENSAEKFHNFEHLIERFVEACNGLPLSLKVLGALVNGQSEADWEDQLLKLPKILPTDIKETLKVSYDALDGEVRQMFLDVACFFIGETKDLAVQIWCGSRWSGELGWKTLVNKCLVEVDKKGNIEMHDHLRDLGRQIAGDVSPSRIWNEEQIGTQDGRTPIRGIVARRRLHFGTSSLTVDTYCALPLDHYMDYLRPSLRALQLVAVKGNNFREEFVASSSGLVWLRLWDFTGINLPSWLSLKSLRVLELYNAQNMEELWQDNVQPPLQLRELVIDLTRMTCFQGLPRSIGHLRHLKKIVLNGNGNGMKTLPEEFCHLGSLETLEMSDFSMLSSLPDQFGELRNLRSLIFSGVQLTALPDSFKQLRLLKFLDISNSQTFCFTSEMLNVLDFMTELQTLKISHCDQLVLLPDLTTLISLRELNLSYTGLREIPNNIGQLTKLETLVIGSDNLTSLPESLGELSCLTSLEIYDCHLLKALPETVGRLSSLQSLKIEDTPILELGSWTRSTSRCSLKSLKCLSLFNTRVSMISISGYCCPSLETLQLRCNTQLTSIWELPKNVREIMVHGCEKLWCMPVSCQENLVITDCPKFEVPDTKSDSSTGSRKSLWRASTHRTIWCDDWRSLPDSRGALSRLTHLRISGHKTPNLRSLPESLGALPCLISLSIENCYMLESLESLGALPCLVSLSIEHCYMLESLPQVLGHLSNLRCLNILSTPVVELGFGVGFSLACSLQSLQVLYLFRTRVCMISISDDWCPSLETLELSFNYCLIEIETLPGNVRKIKVGHCERLKNMRGVAGLQNLKRLEVVDCPEVEELPCPSYMHYDGHEICITGCPKLQLRGKEVEKSHSMGVSKGPTGRLAAERRKARRKARNFIRISRDVRY